jgi:hypothetical protein
MGKEIRVLQRRLQGLGRIPFTAEGLMAALLDALGEKKMPSHLGAGTFAEVYWLKGDRKRVLKITTDPADAYASEIVRRHPSKNLPRIHKVYEIVPRKLFAIVAEKLQPLSATEFKEWANVIPAIGMDDDNSSMAYDLTDSLLRRGLSPEWVETWKQAREEIASSQEDEDDDWMDDDLFADLDPEDRELLQTTNVNTIEVPDHIFDTLEDWGQDLQQRNITFADLHAKNIMKRGRIPVLVELGSSVVPTQPLERFHVPTEG